MTGQSRPVNHRGSKSFNGLGRFQPRELHQHLLRGSRLDRSTLRREFEQLDQVWPWSGLARFGPTTPTHSPGLPLAFCRTHPLSCCRTLFVTERVSSSAREPVPQADRPSHRPGCDNPHFRTRPLRPDAAPVHCSRPALVPADPRDPRCRGKDRWRPRASPGHTTTRLPCTGPDRRWPHRPAMMTYRDPAAVGHEAIVLPAGPDRPDADYAAAVTSDPSDLGGGRSGTMRKRGETGGAPGGITRGR
jgi:hypothetical protein